MFGKKIENFYRVGMIKEKKLLQKYKKRYAGIAFSANWVAHYKKSFPTIINDIGVDYFIDPMNYVFGRNPEILKKGGEIKKSYIKLKNEYGITLNENLNEKLTPNSFKSNRIWDMKKLEDFCKPIIYFQKRFSGIPEEIKRYSDLVKKTFQISINPPIFLLPPYFFSEVYGDDWYQLSLLLARISKRLYSEAQNIFPVICISKVALRSNIEKIVEDYKEFDGIFLWIPDFDELNETEENISIMIQFIKELSTLEKPIYSLYGGYFFGLLSKFGLTGFSCGICYGEQRTIDYISKGGGFQYQVRYYSNLLKKKIKEIDGRKFFKSHPDLLCDCEICSKFKKSPIPKETNEINKYIDNFFGDIKKSDIYLEHFIINRDIELSHMENNTLKELTDYLQDIYDNLDQIEDLKDYDEFRIVHLKKWKDALKQNTHISYLP